MIYRGKIIPILTLKNVLQLECEKNPSKRNALLFMKFLPYKHLFAKSLIFEACVGKEKRTIF